MSDPYEREAAKAAIKVLQRELAEITEQLDEVVDENHSLKFQLKTEKHLNEEHEKDYLAIWKLIKKPNETVVDAAKRIKLNLAEVTKQRDLLIEGLEKLASCDWVITLPDRMDAVREIAKQTIEIVKNNKH